MLSGMSAHGRYPKRVARFPSGSDVPNKARMGNPPSVVFSIVFGSLIFSVFSKVLSRLSVRLGVR